MTVPQQLLRHVPSVDKILATAPVKEALLRCPRWVVLQQIRTIVDEVRAGSIAIVTDEAAKADWFVSLGEEVARRSAAASRYSLQRVVNATGVVLHTNMGRALLAPRAVDHLVSAATRYSNLELDLASGERGKRYDHVRELVCALTGAEDAVVVNNNAAAVLLCLSALAAGREVVTSRGELVEIGGSFRIPDIMKQSGCRLIEVGTTNRVHLRDYEQAVGDDTALLLKVHRSNFRIVGFTCEVSTAELVPLARSHGLPIMHDLGSGCLIDLRDVGLPYEPTVQEALAQGADIVTFSGDKLLGGPQLGVIAGRADLVSRLHKHPLLRALRVDKLTLAAAEATLRIYRDCKEPAAELPSLRMLKLAAEEIKRRAEPFARRLGDELGAAAAVAVVPGSSQVGAGSAPGSGLPTFLVAIKPAHAAAGEIDADLRAMSPPIMARIYRGDLLIDLRTVQEDEEELVFASVARALRLSASRRRAEP